MDLVEQIERAFKAGFNCAMDNVECGETEEEAMTRFTFGGDCIIDVHPGFSLDKATYDYINKVVPYPQAKLMGTDEYIDADISNSKFGV